MSSYDEYLSQTMRLLTRTLRQHWITPEQALPITRELLRVLEELVERRKETTR